VMVNHLLFISLKLTQDRELYCYGEGISGCSLYPHRVANHNLHQRKINKPRYSFLRIIFDFNFVAIQGIETVSLLV